MRIQIYIFIVIKRIIDYFFNETAANVFKISYHRNDSSIGGMKYERIHNVYYWMENKYMIS